MLQVAPNFSVSAAVLWRYLKQHGEAEFLCALFPAWRSPSVHQVAFLETLHTAVYTPKTPILTCRRVSRPPQEIQPKLLSGPHPTASPQTPGHLRSWRMEKQRDHNLGRCSGQCRSTSPEDWDFVSQREVCGEQVYILILVFIQSKCVKNVLWTQVPDLGGGLEPWHCHSRSSERQERSLWQDCAHSVWRGK